MITVNYLDGVDNIRCDEHLFQWDNGQKLCLSGLNTYVPNLETVDVHFCNKISKLAITVKPTVVSNNIVAPIPNSLLQDPYPIIAYFYVPSDNGSRTIVMVTIPIEPKKRPSDFILNEDEAIASLEAINNKVNTTLNNITVDYNDFKVRIEKELQDTVENLHLEDAKTLQSHPASDFVLKVNLPTSLPANGGNADTLDGLHASAFLQLASEMLFNNIRINASQHKISDVDGHWSIWTDKEGGNFELISPDGNHTMQMDMYNNTLFRMYFDGGDGIVHPLMYNFTTKKLNINGDADTVDGKHADAFALKTEIPTSLPANGGNADNANTLGGKSIKDLAYITDIICGLKNGWASASVGTVMTYNNREVVKTTDDLSYIGWFINSEGWFQPLIVSQYKSGTNYTMYGQNCGYDLGFSTSFDYKGRTYYACWGVIGSYQSPTVTGGIELTVTNDDYISACKVLIDHCERIEAVFANTANTASIADVATKVSSPNLKAMLFEDNEGGNLRLISPDGNHSMEMDIYNNEDFRMYFSTSGELTFPLMYNFTTKKLNINGDASTVNGVKLMVGTREPQVEEPNALAYVPEGAWYGQYT